MSPMEFPDELCPICNLKMSFFVRRKGYDYSCNKNNGHFIYLRTSTSEIISINESTWSWRLGTQPPPEVDYYLNQARHPRDDDPSFYKYGL